MPKLGRKTPCAECPWRRTSYPGYLGADDPVHFYTASVVAENSPATAMPCHEQIDYSDEDWRETQYPDVDICAGNMIHLLNWMKMPRDPAMTEIVRQFKRSKAVFDSPEEFMEHHRVRPTDDPEKLAEHALWPGIVIGDQILATLDEEEKKNG